MPNPEVKTITPLTWVKVATSIRRLFLYRVETTNFYYRTYRLTGQPAPAPVESIDELEDTGAILLFADSIDEELKSSEAIDIYILCGSSRVVQTQGKILVGEVDNSRDVFVQDPTTQSGDVHMLHTLNGVTLSAPGVAGGQTLNLVSGHGFVIDDYITIVYGKIYYQSRVYNVVGDVIYLSTPLFYSFPVESIANRKTAKIEIYDGSGTPVIFEIGPPPGVKWHLYGFTFVARDATAMSDEKFVGAPQLEKGMVLARINSFIETRFVVRNNSEMKLVGTVLYSDYSPSEEYGLKFNKDLRNTNGVAMQLDGDLGETIQLRLQDAMTVLTYGRAMLHGHVVEP